MTRYHPSFGQEALRRLYCLELTVESACRAFELYNSFVRRITLSKELALAGVPFTAGLLLPAIAARSISRG